MRIIIRPSTLSDHNFIFATYLRNRWFSKTLKTTLSREVWSAMQHRRLESIIPTALIACLDQDTETIVGYALMDGAEPFTYIKKDWRQLNPPVHDQLLKELVK